MADTANATLTLFLPVSGEVDPEDVGLMFRDQHSEGVLWAPTTTTGNLAVTQRAAGPNLSVDVLAGACWVHQDATSPKPGPAYRVRFASNVNLTVTAPHATLARIDRVVCEVLDTTFAGLANVGRVRIIAGTPAASPVAPAEPANSITLATIAVAAAAASIVNANITDLRYVAGSPGVAAQTPRVRVARGANLVVPNGTFTDIPWDTIWEDGDRMAPSVGGTSVTFRTPGIYMIEGQVHWATPMATGVLVLQLVLNNTFAIALSQINSGVDAQVMRAVCWYPVVRGDFVRVQVMQGTGVNRTVGSSTQLNAVLLSRT